MLTTQWSCASLKQELRPSCYCQLLQNNLSLSKLDTGISTIGPLTPILLTCSMQPDYLQNILDIGMHTLGKNRCNTGIFCDRNIFANLGVVKILNQRNSYLLNDPILYDRPDVTPFIDMLTCVKQGELVVLFMYTFFWPYTHELCMKGVMSGPSHVLAQIQFK